jgi:hypothetical protein
MSAPEGSADPLLSNESVMAWLTSVEKGSLRPEADRIKRLDLMRRYVEYVGTDPDTIVALSRADGREKNRFLKLSVAWSQSLELSERAQHDAENSIRSFFMRNGFRVVARPYRDVYQRPAHPPT